MQHIFRDRNRCVDALTRRGVAMSEDFAVFDSPPNSDIMYLVNMDVVGMFFCRLSATIFTSGAR